MVAVNDAWVDQATARNSLGSRAVSAGSNRLLVAVALTAAGSSDPLTALNWGGQAMTAALSTATTTGRDLDVQVFTLDEAGIAAAVGTAFTGTPNTTGVGFRLLVASYEDVSQTDFSVDDFIDTVTDASNPVSEALTTVDSSFAVAILAANRGTGDGGATEDASYSNMTEQVEGAASDYYISGSDSGNGWHGFHAWDDAHP